MRARWKTKIANALGTILSASCSSALLSFALASREHQLMDRHSTELVAISIATDLEQFAERCSDIAEDYDMMSNPRDGLARALPKLPTWQPDAGWQGLTMEDRDRLFSFRIKEHGAAGYIQSAVKYADRASVLEATRDEAILLGATAWQLAVRLREDNGYHPLRLVQPFGDGLVESASKLTEKWKRGEGAGVDPR